MPGGLNVLSSADNRRLLIADPPMRCTTVSGGMSAGFPNATLITVRARYLIIPSIVIHDREQHTIRLFLHFKSVPIHSETGT